MSLQGALFSCRFDAQLAQPRNLPTAATTYVNGVAQPKGNQVQPATPDPFADLYPPQLTASPSQPQFDLYISGRLTLLRTPSGTCGEWLNAPPCPIWHRRLDVNAFLWLRDAVRRTIESGKLSEEFADAESRLDQIAAIGITNGAFTADEISKQCTAPEWYSFNAGLPTWADEIEPDFLPPSRRNSKAALTTAKR